MLNSIAYCYIHKHVHIPYKLTGRSLLDSSRQGKEKEAFPVALLSLQPARHIGALT